PAKAPAKAAAKTAKSSKPGAKSAEKSAANAAEKAKGGHIFIGIGGWTFEPWRGVFYPKILPRSPECEKSA
ncbi:MAG: hypothetical protein WBE48_09685, partial [Xanthobacteraceae bacterium]